MSITEKNWEIDEIIVSEIMISSEKVAHVQSNNPLEHALLVLVKSGYSAVPVLDKDYKLVGLISKTVILDEILGLERFETEKLNDLKVIDVMHKDELCIQQTASYKEGVNALIDLQVVHLTDKERYYERIVTRIVIVKELKKDYYISNDHSDTIYYDSAHSRCI